MRTITLFIIHCSATPEGKDYTVQDIDRWHKARGWKGIGYRSPALNKAVGGVTDSQHMTGEACDIHLSDMKKLRKWFTHLMDGQFDQLIMERATQTSTHYWIHVSCKPAPSKNRHQVLYLTKSK